MRVLPPSLWEVAWPISREAMTEGAEDDSLSHGADGRAPRQLPQGGS